MSAHAPASSSRAPRRRVLPIVEVMLLIVLLVLPLFVRDFHVVIVTRMLILAMLALSFDLCWGYSGIMTFGQALFFGMAGYTVALLANGVGFTEVWGVLVVSALVGLLAALLLGWFLLLGRRIPSVIFVALGTLTASYAAERLVAGWQRVGAGNGLSIYEFLSLGTWEFEPGRLFYYGVLAVLVAAYLGSRAIVRSQFGLVLAGMRQNEARLAFLGYWIPAFKAIVFAYAGALAGLAGGLYAHHEGYIGPADLGIALSTFVVLYGLFGGVGTLIGPVLGVLAIETLRFTLSDVDALKTVWPVLLGVILLLVVVFKPTGLMGFVLSERERIGGFGRPARAGAAAPVIEARQGVAEEEPRGTP